MHRLLFLRKMQFLQVQSDVIVRQSPAPTAPSQRKGKRWHSSESLLCSSHSSSILPVSPVPVSLPIATEIPSHSHLFLRMHTFSVYTPPLRSQSFPQYLPLVITPSFPAPVLPCPSPSCSLSSVQTGNSSVCGALELFSPCSVGTASLSASSVLLGGSGNYLG